VTLQIKLEQIIRKRFRHTMRLDGVTVRLFPKLAVITHDDPITAHMIARELPNLLKDGMYEGCIIDCRRKGPRD
jgi:hypothetical protein